MKLSEAIMLYESKAILEARILKSSSKDGWCIQFKTKNPVNFTLKLETERGFIRIFKNINAAIKTIKKIGFSKAIIILKV
jgi:hypothetical protein